MLYKINRDVLGKHDKHIQPHTMFLRKNKFNNVGKSGFRIVTSK